MTRNIFAGLRPLAARGTSAGFACWLAVWGLWLYLACLELLFSAYSLSMTWWGAAIWFGLEVDRFDLRLTGFVILDLFKIVAPAACIELWRQGHRAGSVLLASAALLAALFSIMAAQNVVSGGHASAVADHTAQTRRLADLQQARTSLRSELKQLQGYRPLAVVEAEIKVFELDRHWRWTRGCAVEHTTKSSSRAFCRRYFHIRTELAGANRAAVVRREIAALNDPIRALTTGAVITPADSSLSSLALLTGLTPKWLAVIRGPSFASLLEIASVLLVVALTLLSPTRMAGRRQSVPTTASDVSSSTTSRSTGSVDRHQVGVDGRLSSAPTATRSVSTGMSTPGAGRSDGMVQGVPETGDGDSGRPLGRQCAAGPGDGQGRQSTPDHPQSNAKVYSDATEGPLASGGVDEGQETFAAFVDSCINPLPHARTSAKDLYDAYTAWCQRQGHEVLSQRLFGEAIPELVKCQKRRINGCVNYYGFELR